MNSLWRAKTPQVGACSKYVREKQPYVGARRGSHGSTLIPWLPFLAPTWGLFYFMHLLEASTWGVFVLHCLFLYSDMPHPLLPYFQLVQAIFEPNLYLHKYPSKLVLVILTAYNTYEYGRQCSETSAHEIQMPGNRPK